MAPALIRKALKMTATSPEPASAGIPGHATLWLAVEGAILIALGIAAILFPAMAGVAAGVVFGWILFVIGVLGLVSTFSARPHLHFGWSLASSIVTIVAGLIVAMFPLAGTMVLTLAMAAWLIVDGVSSFQIGRGLKRAGSSHWKWPFGSAIVDWVLAACVLALGPIGGAVFIGVVVGVDLILGGTALLGLGRALGRPES